jgi:uncharacterized membrane protein
MTLPRLRLAMGALALAAAGISAYRVFAHYAKAQLACVSGGGCEAVQKSRYSEIGDVPISLLGLLVYVLLVVVSARKGELAALVGFAASLAAGLFAVYLIVVQAIVLDQVCIWCLATDAIALLLAVLGTLRLRAEPAAPDPA